MRIAEFLEALSRRPLTREESAATFGRLVAGEFGDAETAAILAGLKTRGETPDVMAGATRQSHGRWEDGAVSAAGPYRYYEVTRGTTRFQVDLAVFAPGRPKLPYLRELHAIAETIEPARGG